MRWFWLVFIMFFGFLQMKAQDILQTIDSLDSVAKNQEGIEKIVTMLELAEYLNEISFDECISMVEKAEHEARKINHNLFISQTNLELGEYYIKHYDLDLAEPYLRIALENSGDKYYLKYDAYYSLGYLYRSFGNVDTASYYFEKSLETAQWLGEKELCADAINNIALLNRDKGDQEEALRGFEESVMLYYEINDSLYAARSLNNIAMIYYARKQYDEALSIFNDLIPFFEKEGVYRDLSRTYSNLGMIISEYTNDMDSAMNLFVKAKDYACIGNDSLEMVDILLNEGEVFM